MTCIADEEIRHPGSVQTWFVVTVEVAPVGSGGIRGFRVGPSNPLILLAPLPGHVSNHVPRFTAGVSPVARAGPRPSDGCLQFGSRGAPAPASWEMVRMGGVRRPAIN